jgi:putative tricarboxylic transport membrane protein
MKKLGYPIAPLILGVLLGPIAEENMRRALLGSHMDYSIFITRPISLTLLVIAAITLIWPWAQDWYQQRVAKKAGVKLDC